MVFFNYATMQMAAKIVYYGPGLCGKTTNLHHIYQKTSPQSRGEMVSLETETDRTLFFDLLPIDVGVIGGFKTRLQLYTVPGQVFYNTTRKLVLKGADGIVFVADSQKPMLDANAESLRNLRENLAEIGLDLDEMPVVLQLNKRDLANISSVDELLNALDSEGRYEHVEASAVTGTGVFETLKLISKLTLRNLRKRMMGDEPASRIAPIVRQPRSGGPAAAATPPATPPAAPATSAPPSTFATVERPLPSTFAKPLIPPPSEVRAQPAAAAAPSGTPAVDHPQEASVGIAEVEVAAPAAEPEALPEMPPAAQTLVGTPAAPEEPVAAASEVLESATEPEVLFEEAPREAKVEVPAVKHVKVRSSTDIMAELDLLRKKATQGAPRAKKDPLGALESLLATPRKPIVRSLTLPLPAAAFDRTRVVRTSITVEDEEGNVLQSEEVSHEVGSPAEVRDLLLNYKLSFTRED